MKRQTLLEMVQFVNDTRNCFNEGLMQDVVNMTSNNIFRSLPARRRFIPPYLDPEAEEPQLQEAWLHLQLVYEFFLRFIVSADVDPKIAKRYVDSNFILNILELCDTEDPRERDYLKTILHRAYGKFMTLRSFVRSAITQVFYQAIYECDYRNGISELLEILGSIINGFALPLKEEHRDFLLHGLLPLHKVKHVAPFHQQLAYCTMQYVEKDTRLTVNIIEALLRYWPSTCSSKQVLFLNELEELLELIQPAEFAKVVMPVFKRVAKCIRSSQFQISERALLLWNNDCTMKLVGEHRKPLYPLIMGALYENSRGHWNSTVSGLTFNVLKLMMETDKELFDECGKANATSAADSEKASAMDPREITWETLRKRCQKGLAKGEKSAPPGTYPPVKRKHGIPMKERTMSSGDVGIRVRQSRG